MTAFCNIEGMELSVNRQHSFAFQKKSIDGVYQIHLDPVVILQDNMVVMVTPISFTTGTRLAAKHCIGSTTRHSNDQQYLLRAYKDDYYDGARQAFKPVLTPRPPSTNSLLSIVNFTSGLT
jgi:hypothetical protein